jgi:hypothetical protein
MKRIFIISALILLIYLLAAALFVRPALKFLVKKQLEKAFVGSAVQVEDVRISALKYVKFIGIGIKKQNEFDIKIEEAGVSYSLFSLLKGARMDIRVGFFEGSGARLEDAFLTFDSRKNSGELRISNVRYNKAKIEDISAKLRLKDKTLFLEELKAQAFEGKVEGLMALSMEKVMGYEARLDFSHLSIDRFIVELDLQDRFRMTGYLSGNVFLSGRGQEIVSLDGGLSTIEPGGALTITDKAFLENLARTSQQSLDILVESFKNYHYNKGTVKLGMEQKSPVMDLNLEGEAGSRNLRITLHQVNSRREP